MDIEKTINGIHNVNHDIVRKYIDIQRMATDVLEAISKETDDGNYEVYVGTNVHEK